MLSFRTLARSAPRTLTRLATASMRPAMLARPAATSMAQSGSFHMLRAATSNSFSTTAGRRAAAAADGETDDELSAKIESEIQIEEEMKAGEQEPSSVKDFIDNSAFELIDTPGQEVVKLVRTFGEEKITISFSIADINNFDPYADEAALEDEGLTDDLQAAESGKQRAANQDVESSDLETDLDEEETPAPITLSIIVEKPGKTPGALAIDAAAQDGTIVVENLFYYADAKLAKLETPEAAQQRADVYPGPPFGSLDEDLQVLVERFLEERGVTQALAVFVPDYVDLKEQNEYLRWLNNVKGFIDA
ncbi:regulatory protein SUAPRGA1 [Cordyceps militaris CM01]|uniref:Regulatory protein SUAPRGA1 n=2 Tax=Cordyceps militaris TaxID=73501 RepID=G3JIY2_CORMM|nr:regulatory protein SUAPRGA1 [Cordyceps militaris CM01]ATY58786.1 regulatory SUAPRGA1 [Cordyceps militaris]EGX91976.1 regulatory protein SUAPRGA1 [Cordyceps militaris CM01]